MIALLDDLGEEKQVLHHLLQQLDQADRHRDPPHGAAHLLQLQGRNGLTRLSSVPNQYWCHLSHTNGYATSDVGWKFGLLYNGSLFFFTVLTPAVALGQPIAKCPLVILVGSPCQSDTFQSLFSVDSQIYQDVKHRNRRQMSMSRHSASATNTQQARRKQEDNLAIVFMGIVLVFLICHSPR